MRLVVGLAIFFASTLAYPAENDSQDAPPSSIYYLKSPANVLVEYGSGQTATATQRQLFLRQVDSADPTSSLVCKQLQNDYHVFFVPRSSLPTFTQTQISTTVNLEEKLDTESWEIPWIIFLKKEHTVERLPSNYKKIVLKSINPDDPWELGAYTIASPSDLAEYSDETLAAPPPFFPSLCVSPEKPKPFPVLFAPSNQQQSSAIPSLASFTIADLTPAVATHAVPMVASAPSAPSPLSVFASAPSPSAVFLTPLAAPPSSGAVLAPPPTHVFPVPVAAPPPSSVASARDTPVEVARPAQHAARGIVFLRELPSLYQRPLDPYWPLVIGPSNPYTDY